MRFRQLWISTVMDFDSYGISTVMDFDSYGTSGLTKKKPPETERRFCALRLLAVSASITSLPTRVRGPEGGLYGVITRTSPVVAAGCALQVISQDNDVRPHLTGCGAPFPQTGQALQTD